MKVKTKRKTKQTILSELAEIGPIIRSELPSKRTIRKGTRFVTRLIMATGIPEAYSESIAWFAERMALATLCLFAASFAAGAMFVLYWSEPISESQFYEGVTRGARVTQEGIKIYTQQVIDVASPIFGGLVKENREERDLVAEQLAERKAKLKAYLESKKSPFAEDDKALDAFVNSKNMKLMVAISFVESTFGKHCYYFNCSGIGGTPPNLRKYDSYEEWIKDFDDLLERRYKDLPPEKFIGLYVQPGSPNWLYGVKQVIKEFEEQGIEG
ncbi:MAG TPA: hypothetical protein VD998_03555 [Verrucomicrobiae bacterium]|nr:hypothetical protein [Verrucomicrobiae bacterium]